MHFYESSIITTKDGLHCQVYGNEHPKDAILIKPKYIPASKVESTALPYRFITGRKMNRLNLWGESSQLKRYISEFSKAYPHYIYHSNVHEGERLFFAVPIDHIERIYFPRRGLRELMSMPEQSLDEHLKLVYQLIKLFLQSGLRLKDLGVTYSTLMGHYNSSVSDINIVVYGKENFWNLLTFLEEIKHPLLRWKTDNEWHVFLQKRNRLLKFGEKKAIELMKRKKTEGYFGNTLFILFAAEKEEEVWFKWGEEKYRQVGMVSIQAVVKSNWSSIVRPGCYDIEPSSVVLTSPIAPDLANHTKIENEKNIISKAFNLQRVVFYNRDYCLLAFPNEKIEVQGLLEEVIPGNGEKYYQIVVGYFDSYTNGRRDQEYIKVL